MFDKVANLAASLRSGIGPGWRAVFVAGLCAAIMVAAMPLTQAGPGFELGRAEGRETGLPIPRFVSLKNEPAMMRVGPSRTFAIKWVYRRRGVPLEIIAEYENWRQVRDVDGETGWMHHALLSGRRTAIVASWLEESVPMREAPSSSAVTVALLHARVALRVISCDGSWCRVAAIQHDVRGYVAQKLMWGAYTGEVIGNY